MLITKSMTMRKVTALIIFLIANNSYANLIFDCRTTRIIKAGAGVPPQPLGGKFRFTLGRNQAWAAPFHTDLLFTKIKAAPNGKGGDSALFSAQGFNMPEATMFFETSKNNEYTITASQLNTSIFATCVDITTEVRNAEKKAEQRSENEKFSAPQLQSGLGWYVSRTGRYGFSLENTTRDFEEKYLNESRAAIMRSENESPGWHNHYIMIGPYSSKEEAESVLPRIKKDVDYATIFKMGINELKGTTYMDNVHRIIKRNFKSESPISNSSKSISNGQQILEKITQLNNEYFLTLANLAAFADKNILSQPQPVYAQVQVFSDNILSPNDSTGIFQKFNSEKNRISNLIDTNKKSMSLNDFTNWIANQVEQKVTRFNDLNSRRNTLISNYNDSLKK